MAFQRRGTNGGGSNTRGNGRAQTQQRHEDPPDDHGNNGSGKKPIWTRSLGTGKGQRVEVAIWENLVQQEGGGSFTAYSVTVSRNYHDGKEWKSTSSFKEGDLGALAIACQMAVVALAENRAEQNGTDDQS